MVNAVVVDHVATVVGHVLLLRADRAERSGVSEVMVVALALGLVERHVARAAERGSRVEALARAERELGEFRQRLDAHLRGADRGGLKNEFCD